MPKPAPILSIREYLPYGSPCLLVWERQRGGTREKEVAFIGACRSMSEIKGLKKPEARFHTGGAWGD